MYPIMHSEKQLGSLAKQYIPPSFAVAREKQDTTLIKQYINNTIFDYCNVFMLLPFILVSIESTATKTGHTRC